MSGDGGRVAAITGTSRGLGAATARLFLTKGYRVVGVSRSGGGDSAAGLIELNADLEDSAACEALVERILTEAGRIDVLINNAATLAYAPCWDLEPAQLETMLRINLTAPFILCRDVLRHWIATGRIGTIVNICSIESEVAWDSPPQAAYATTKGGLAGLTRALAHDYGHLGIRVNAVAPGIIRTPFTPLDQDLSGRVPLQGRLAEPEEIASAVAYLCSDDASYVTGEILYVDGGYRLP